MPLKLYQLTVVMTGQLSGTCSVPIIKLLS